VNPRKTALLAILLIATASLAAAQGTFTQIDFPNSTQTFCVGLDAAGDVSGSYADAHGNWHGFLLQGQNYITVDYPGGQNTYVQGMNNSGQLVGYTGAGSNFFSFVYDIRHQFFTQISYPGASATTAFALSDSGAVAGQFVDSGDVVRGFEMLGSGFRRIAPRAATTASVTGITTAGTLVGFFSISTGVVDNFWFLNGNYRRLSMNNKPKSAEVLGINPSGTMLVGRYPTAGQNYSAFSYRAGTLRILKVPGASSTIAYGANDGGEVVGAFVDGQSHQHGFLWTAPKAASREKP